MKNIRISLQLLALVFSLLFLSTCRDDESAKETRKVQFRIPSGAIVDSDGRVAAFQPDALLVSIEDASSEPVYTMEEMEIYQIEDGYISVPLELPVGDYKLTLFALIDSEDNIVAATPTEDSPMAEYVDDPLPIAFTVTKEETTLVHPQVLVIQDGMDIGYGQFGIDVVALLPIVVAVFDNQILTTADIIIEGTKDGQFVWTKQVSLLADANDLLLKGGMDMYHFTVIREGYYPIVAAFSLTDLKNNPNRFFYLLKTRPQLKSLTADVYCCPGSGFVPTKIDFTYNSLHRLSKTVHKYFQKSNQIWVQQYSTIHAYIPVSNTPVNVRYQYANGKYDDFKNTLSADTVISIMTVANAGGSLGNYLITPEYDLVTGRMTSAVLKGHAHNIILKYSYGYHANGDLLSFEARDENDQIQYAGEFTYDSHANVYPSYILGDWLENMTSWSYPNLLHIPFITGVPNHNVASYQLTEYSSGTVIRRETVTMNYTYNANDLPESLSVWVKVETTGYPTREYEAQKATVFEYQ